MKLSGMLVWSVVIVVGCGARTPLGADQEGEFVLEPTAPEGVNPLPPLDNLPPEILPPEILPPEILPPEILPPEDPGPSVLLDCPTTLDDPRLPWLGPGHPGTLVGNDFARVPISQFRWSVVNQGCDAMLPQPRYEVMGVNSPTLSFTPARPGAYEIGLQVQTESGRTEQCAFHVWAAGYGLMVELCWDTSTSTDLDLYLHAPDQEGPWFAAGSSDAFAGVDSSTCNAVTCAAEPRYGLPRTDWGYADSSLGRCTGSPDFGGFGLLGRCPNPRAANDNNQTIASGTAELVQLDNPRNNETFRVMVQNFDNRTAEPYVAIYCGGILESEFAPPAWPPGFIDPGATGFGVMWRPADVRMHVDSSGVTIGCSVEPLYLPNSVDGYVTINDPSY